MLRIKLVRSPIGETPRNRATVVALGLKTVGQIVTKEDVPTIRGMVHHAKHMLVVWEGENEVPIYDGTKVRKFATRKSKKPSESRRS